MQYLSFILVLSCLYITAASQKQKTRFELESFEASKFKPLTVEIETNRKPELQTQFNTIIIRDFRADKSKLGFARAGEKIENRRFVFPEEDKNYLAKKTNELFSSNSKSGDTILVALKNLWLFQSQQQAGAVKREFLGEIQRVSHCFINCDVYSYKQGNTTNIGTIDTVISTNGWIVNKSESLLKTTLLTSLYICDSLLKAQDAVTDHFGIMKPDLNFPICSTEHPKKGIYFSFQNFLNNNPDTSVFETETKKERRILKSSSYPDSIIAGCWGFSDGNAVYMNINNDYYRLNRSQKTFDLRGPFYVDIKNTTFSKIFRTASYSLVTMPLIDPSEFLKPRNEKLEFFKYYQLDMITGSLK
jgi:hypothetical protein